MIIKGFKGLAEHIEPSQLKPEYATEITDLDADNPLGRLTLRPGFEKKYSTSFTNILSSFEFTIEDDSNAVIFVVNDNGTFKYFKNGSYIGSLTPPGGATVATNFTHNYFGWRNAIRITTGNAASNYVLWFGFTSRDETNNDGLFGDAIGDSGTGEYKFLRSQLIPVNGVIHPATRNMIYLGGYYYVSVANSKWIDKLDSNLQLVDRWAVNEDETVTAADKGQVSLTSDGTYLYAATTGGVYQLDPDTHKCSAYITQADILDICNDGTDIFFIDAAEVYRHAISGFTLDDSADADSSGGVGFTDATCISCDDTATTGNIFIGDQAVVRQRGKNDIAADDDTYDLTNVDASMDYIYALEWKDADQVFVACSHLGSSNFIVDLDASGVSTKNAEYDTSDLLVTSFVYIGGTTIRAVDIRHSMIKHVDAATLVYPEFMTVSIPKYSSSGQLGAGTYFYKICMEDENGQVYTLSDPLTIVNDGSFQHELRVDVTGDRSESDPTYGKFSEFTRAKYIHIFRAYSSSADAKEPSTAYNQLKSIDINDVGWAYNSDYDIYYFDYTDNQVQSSISPTTYFEMSGISENTKPRHVNGKYWVWVNDELHLANIYTDGNAYQSRIVRSPADAPDAVSFYNVYRFEQFSGEGIKGISSLYGRSVVFKERVGGFFNDGVAEDTFYPGISSDRGHVKVSDLPNETIYYDNEKGIFKLVGTSPVLISDPVRSLHKASSQDHDTATMFYFDDYSRLAVCYAAEDYSLIYNVKYDIWTRYGTAWQFRNLLKNSDNEYIGVKNTYIYKLFSGTTDDGNDIAISYRSGILNFDGVNHELHTIFSRLSIVTEDGTSTLKIYKFDDSDAAGRTLVKTVTLNDADFSLYPIMIKNYLQNVWGESFQLEYSGTVSKFMLAEIRTVEEPIGDAEIQV